MVLFTFYSVGGAFHVQWIRANQPDNKNEDFSSYLVYTSADRIDLLYDPSQVYYLT